MDRSSRIRTRRSIQARTANPSAVFPLRFPDGLTPVHFIKLNLTDGSKVVSENLYWRGTTQEDYVALNEMEKTKLIGSFSQAPQNGHSTLDIRLENPTSHLALMVCAKVVKSSSPGQRVLPIFYDDNYVTLFPHESRHIHAEFDSNLLKGDLPRVVIEGWNVPSMDTSSR